jgi:hypothetical protein
MVADAILMIRLVVGAVLLACGTVAVLETPATADCSGGTSATISGTADAGTLVIGAEQEVSASTCLNSGPASASLDDRPRDSDLDAMCVQQAISVRRNPFEFCDLPSEPGSIKLTPGMVATAFRRLPLPPSDLVVQPPGGRTLVNFETNFYTENGEFTRTLSLLGQRVELRIWPSAYEWRFGDGVVRQTAEAGSPYPDLEITHRYLSKGRVSPQVDTTYAAEFRVDGGPWRDVAGTVTIPGSPQGLRVVTARPVLVGYR